MTRFETKALPREHDCFAPDSMEVRLLPALSKGSFAHFTLKPSKISLPVAHGRVEEIWYFLGGRGEMWRKLGEQEEVVEVGAGLSVTIPVGTHFQLRSLGTEPLTAVAVTMPPWDGPQDAYSVDGKWPATVISET